MEKGTLLDFNSARERGLSVLENEAGLTKGAIDMIMKGCKASYPLIYQLLTETTRFYEEHFPQLIGCIAREKRQLNFETPNRVKMQYEYELEGSENLTEGAYYLFNTRSRLSWLIVEMESNQVAVASSSVVKQKLSAVLNNEDKKLAKVLEVSQEEILDLLYNTSDGKPCFVNFIKDTNSVKISYYDSMQQSESQKSIWIKKIFNPIAERDITYVYRSLAAKANSWLYIKAPDKFAIEANPIGHFYESSPSTDKEVNSFVFTGGNERPDREIRIQVKVPISMKIWYHTMLWLAVIVLGALPIMVGLFYSDFLCACEKTHVQYFLQQIPKGVYALIAAILATRGWLMHEEYVLGRLSRWYTIMIVLLLCEVGSILLFVA